MTATPSTGQQTGQSGQQVDVQVEAMDAKSISSIQLASGWVNVKNCELIQFAVGTAHSPISPNRLYPYLKFSNEQGQRVRVPFSAVLGLSEEPANVSQSSRQQFGTTQQS